MAEEVAAAGIPIVAHALEEGVDMVLAQIKRFIERNNNGFEGAWRRLSIGLVNDTKVDIWLLKFEFYTGRVESHPVVKRRIPPGHHTSVHVVKSDGSILTGVSGYAEFQDDTGAFYGIGFSCPSAGVTKCNPLKSRRSRIGAKAYANAEGTFYPGVGKQNDYEVTVQFALVDED